MAKLRIGIGGMTCAACSSSIERELNSMDGVDKVAVNLATNTASVDYDETVVSRSEIFEAIEGLGFDIVDSENKDVPTEKTGIIIAFVFTAILVYIAMGPMVGIPVPGAVHNDPEIYATVQMMLCIPVVAVGRGFYARGFPNLVRLRPNMDTLIALGTSAAFVFSLHSLIRIFEGAGDVNSLYFESAAVIITLVMCGKYLESRSKYQTGEAVRALMRLSPQEANVIRDGVETIILTKDIQTGDIIVIRPGERVPADGMISEGTTTVDESMLTGESRYIDRTVGDMIRAGTININGSVRMTAELVGQDTMLSQIVRMMEDAQSSKAPVARLADRVAGYFVPAVMAIAFVACITWLLTGKDTEFSLTVFISVLVIACPCALGLATPLAIVVGTGRGAEHGILFKTAESLELAGRVDIVVLDKTGTITAGRPDVTDVISDDTERLLFVTASAESDSEHPLGSSIVEYARSHGIVPVTPADFVAHIGLGIECKVNGRMVRIGRPAFIESTGTDISGYIDDVSRLANEGKTVSVVSEDNKVLGIIAVSDRIKMTSASAVSSLKDMSIGVAMVTGDSSGTANSVAKDVNIGDVVSGALPGDKISYIRKLQDEGRVVAMAGDGINDAPALTQSDVGMAVGSGTDIAVGSADVVLMNDDLRNVPAAIEIGRRTLRSIKENLFFAFCYNIIGIPVAAGLLYLFGGPLLDPMIAAAAMSLSSVSVVLNSLRLRSFAPVSLARDITDTDNPVS